eukprot:1011732-Pelagomonas_calceolata.AAC.2
MTAPSQVHACTGAQVSHTQGIRLKHFNENKLMSKDPALCMSYSNSCELILISTYGSKTCSPPPLKLSIICSSVVEQTQRLTPAPLPAHPGHVLVLGLQRLRTNGPKCLEKETA